MEQFLLVNIVMGIVRLVTLIVDIVTFPIYYIVQMPWKKKPLMNKKYAVQICSGDDEVTYKSVEEKLSSGPGNLRSLARLGGGKTSLERRQSVHQMVSVVWVTKLGRIELR